MSASFFARLNARCLSIDSLLCVGLDPHVSDLTGASLSGADGARVFCERLIAATAPYAAAFKPNAAFFEVFGAEGATALRAVIAAARATGALVILDGKRGDISTTAEAYAASAFDYYAADCVTLNAYMGTDSILPFTKTSAEVGAFLLCKTSNPSAGELQTLVVHEGGVERYLFEHVAKLTSEGKWGKGGADGQLGLVVGATDVESLRRVRAAAPQSWILAPGVGFQGGDLTASLKAGLFASSASATTSALGILLPVSRGISRAENPATAAAALRDEINKTRREIAAAVGISAAASGANSSSSTSASSASSASPSPSSSSSVSAAASVSYKDSFIVSALSCGVLKFGSFKLKSGRMSPFFFNAGQFTTGGALSRLGQTYAAAIRSSGIEFDILFGPAYKGIPLVATTAVALASPSSDSTHGAALPPPSRDVPFAYNRKEAKDHGEGGLIVGPSIAGKKVLIVDDVITAGTAVGEAVEIIKAAGGIPVGVVIGLDRQEKGLGEGVTVSAVQSVTQLYSIPVIAVATLSDLLDFIAKVEKDALASPTGPLGQLLKPADIGGISIAELLAAIREYRKMYGVEGL